MKSLLIKDYLALSSVIPVVVIEHIEDAVPLSLALIKGGISVIEVTLRTECALEAIRIIREKVPAMCIGAGTINTPALLKKAVEAKVQFLVSPGSTDDLLEAAEEIDIPLLPGVSTASEAMKLLTIGYRYLKFFPAEAAGGIKMLKSLGGPLSELSFCPTGGVDNRNSKAYLELKNVICIGSSWITDKCLIDEKNWDEISRRASEITATKSSTLLANI